MNIEDLTFGELRSVVMLAQHKHFGRAAAALRIAQPTLSAQIQKVESVLGATIFERSKRRFFITRAGEALLPLIEDTLKGLDRYRTIQSSASTRAPLSGEFRLGVIPTLGPYLIPELLPQLKQSFPLLEITIHEAMTELLLEELLSGRLDAAVLSPPFKQRALQSIPLFVEPFQIIASQQHKILEAKNLLPSMLMACDMVLLEEGHCMRDQVLEFCNKRKSAAPKIVTTSLETLKYLVAMGSGYSLVPELAASSTPALAKLVSYRRFDAPAPSRLVSLTFRRNSAVNQDVEAFSNFVKENLPAGVLSPR